MGIRTKLSSMGYNGESVWDELHTDFMIKINDNTTYTINIVNPDTYINPITIDWGDSIVEVYEYGVPSHTYVNGGNYKISIFSDTGKMPYFTFQSDDNLLKILTPFMECYNGDIVNTNFYRCFRWCNSLEYLPNKLFIKNPSITDFGEMLALITRFSGDNFKIPKDLFLYTPNAISFNHCFYNSDISYIPEGLFDACISATDFSNCFYYSNITSIPKGLFDTCVNAKNFTSCFANTSVSSIPEGLFDKNVNIENLSSCFAYTSIASIPENLFKNNVNITSIAGMFNSSYITSIPEGLFDACINLNNISNCFSNCTSLTTVPLTLFDNNSKITNISGCFYNCNNITSSIPELWNRANVTNVSRYCSLDYKAINWLKAPYTAGGPTSLTINVIPEDANIEFTFAGTTFNKIEGNTAYTADGIINYTVSKENYRPQSNVVQKGNYIKDITLLEPTNTLTINVIPDNAIVTLIDESNIKYTTNTYKFALGEVINYTIELDGYLTKTGTITINGNTVINLELTRKETLLEVSYPFDNVIGDTTNFIDNTNFIYSEEYKSIINGPSSYHVNNGTSYGYIPLSTDSNVYTLDITAYISSESSFDFGGIYLGTNIYNPTQSQAKSKIGDGKGEYIFSISGNTTETKYTKVLEPSTNYYLNAFYVKDSISNVNLDRLFIKSISCYYTAEDATFKQLTINTVQDNTTVMFVTSDGSTVNGNTIVFDNDTLVQYIVYSQEYGYRIGKILVDSDITIDLDLSVIPEQDLVLYNFTTIEDDTIDKISSDNYLPFDNSILVPECHPVIITGTNNDTEADIMFISNNSGDYTLDFSIPQGDIDNVEVITNSLDNEDNIEYNINCVDIYNDIVTYNNNGTGSISGIYQDISKIQNINTVITNNNYTTTVNYTANNFYSRYYFNIYNNGKTYEV